MNRKIEPATADDVRHVALHMRERDFEELSATSRCDSREELADALAKAYGNRPDVLCGSADGVPVCIGGTLEMWPGVISLLFIATADFPRIGQTITRFIRRELFPRYEAAGVHRIQAISLAGYDEIHNWLRALGLQQEGLPMRAYGRNGEDFVTFARVKNAR